MDEEAVLLCSRIFHDLASPLGAIAAGIEFLEMSGANQAEHALISDSLQATMAKLTFFRWAFGPATAGFADALEFSDTIPHVAKHLRITGLPERFSELDRQILSIAVGMCLDTHHGQAELQVQTKSNALVVTLPFLLSSHLDMDRSPFPAALRRSETQARVAIEEGAGTTTLTRL